ncbi:UNVERIFIED_CONTAM: hypothetical protein Scaly_1086600 [Sesamum calycinum]|uniref:Protein IQ-DOMAIN 1 n=1 Tax=Sesamum calycinum TaxID=2727403 RepID=A0AAW2QLC4_9LAMI
MGITGELVRNVFSKSRSVQRHDSQVSLNSDSYLTAFLVFEVCIRTQCLAAFSVIMEGAMQRRRKNGAAPFGRTYAVMSIIQRLQLMIRAPLEVQRLQRWIWLRLGATGLQNISIISGGGDVTSVYADEDTTSMRSSEATVNQPLHGDSKDEDRKEKQNSTYRLFRQEDAALIIQAAFRSFQARRAQREAKMQDDEHEPTASPSRESIGTSIEVQTGNSSDIFSIKEESFDVHQKIRHRARAQVLKIQEDWDDSTVSSVIAKMRTQHRLEAATRRERALAYAFSQQLRICSKKKQSTTSGDETNMGWNWLERWMAARQPELTLMGEIISGGEQKTVIRKRMLDAAMEEESCGSNEVSSLAEVGVLSAPKNVPRPAKTRSKATRNLSRQNSTSSHLCPRESKDTKKACHLADEKEKRKRTKQPVGNKREIKNATTQVSLEHENQQ